MGQRPTSYPSKARQGGTSSGYGPGTRGAPPSGFPKRHTSGHTNGRVPPRNKRPFRDRTTPPVIQKTYPSGYSTIFREQVERAHFTSHKKLDAVLVKVVTDPDEAREVVLPALMESRSTVYDAETGEKGTGLATTNTKNCDVVLSSFCPLIEGWSEYKPTYVLEGNDTILQLRPWFESPDHLKVGHNLGFDRNVVRDCFGFDFQGFYADTMLMYWSLDTEMGEGKGATELNLETILQKEYGLPYKHFEEVWGKIGQVNMWDVIGTMYSAHYNREEAVYYSAKDVWEDAWLYEDIKRILKNENLWDVARMVEFPFLLQLELMEEWGMAVDTHRLEEIRLMCEDRFRRLHHRWRYQVGSKYANPSSASSKQKQHIFFTHGEYISKTGAYSRPGPHRTMECGCARPHKYNPKNPTHISPISKAPSTGKAAMERLELEGCAAATLLRTFGSDEEVLKFAKGFLKGLTTQHSATGSKFHTVHPSWWGMLKTTRTSAGKNRFGTGRTLQNIPKDPAKDPYRIRGGFVARPGYSLLASDYDQLENRILAFLTQDETMLDVFATGKDPHSMMAVVVFNLPCSWEEVKREFPEKREYAKKVVYGIPYGLTTFGLAQQLKISEREANNIVNMWFDAAPRVRDYIHDCHTFARLHGYTVTFYGHRRYLPKLSRYRSVGEYAPPLEEDSKLRHEYNVAANHPIQSFAGLLMRMAQVTLAGDPKYTDLGMRMAAQVHDEIIVEVPLGNEEEAMSLLKHHMEGAKDNVMRMALGDNYPHRAPDFTAGPGKGMSWEEAK